jgi:hypothetical protein
MPPLVPGDPASLSGTALDQWYRRTPDEIEAARQAAAQQRYDGFFGPSGVDAASNQDQGDGAGSVQDQSDADSSGNGAGSRYLQLASTAVSPTSSVLDHLPNCPTCHGRAPLPPPTSLPWPWSIGVYVANRVGGGASKPPPPDRKQCEIQSDSDHQICGRQDVPNVRAVCRQRANIRYKHCLAAGEMNSPISLMW